MPVISMACGLIRLRFGPASLTSGRFHPIGTTEFRAFWHSRLRDSSARVDLWLDSPGGIPVLP